MNSNLKNKVFKKTAFLVAFSLLFQLAAIELLPLRVKAVAWDWDGHVENGEHEIIYGSTGMDPNVIRVDITVDEGGILEFNDNPYLEYTKLTGSLTNNGLIICNSYNHQIDFPSSDKITNNGIILGSSNRLYGKFLPGITIGNKSLIEEDLYVGNSITLYAPEGYGISLSEPADGEEITSTSVTIKVEDLSTTRNYWLSKGGYRSWELDIPQVSFRTSAYEPEGEKYLFANTYDKVGNFFYNKAEVIPPDGYEKVNVYIGNVLQGSGTVENPYVINHSVRGYQVSLTDVDGLETSKYPLENINVLQSDDTYYTVEGEVGYEDGLNDFPIFYEGATIKATERYSIVSAEDYRNASDNIEGKDEIKISETKRDIEIYVQLKSEGYWMGPVSVGRIQVDLDTPDNPYSVSGTTENGKYIKKAVLTPAEGYKVTTSKDKTPVSELSFTSDQKGLKVFLAKEIPNENGDLKYAFTKEIAVADILFKTKANMPETPYTLTGTLDSTGAYRSDVVLTPAEGYTVTTSKDKEAVTSIKYTSTTKNAKIYLVDEDGLYSDEITVSDIIIKDKADMPEEPYTLSGTVDTKGAFRSAVTLTPAKGYKVTTSKDKKPLEYLMFSKTTKDVSIFLYDEYGMFTDEIKVGDIVILDKAYMPETPYTLSGTKYKDKKYQSDVILTPAKGYKVTTSKDKKAEDSIKFTSTTKGSKIYLVDEYNMFTDEITVEDIYILREGKAEIKAEDAYFGGKLNMKLSSDTNEAKKATFKYKDSEGNELKAAPSMVGKYTVEATLPDNDNYREVTVKDDFEIRFLPAPLTPYSIEGTLGNNNFYTSNVTIIPAEGYSISRVLNSEYSDSLVISSDSEEGYVYLKKISTNEMTDKIPIKEFTIDKVLPEIKGADTDLIYSDNVTISVSDDYLSEVFVNGEKVSFKAGVASISLDPEGGIKDFTIKAIDKAGNVTEKTVKVFAEWIKSGEIPSGKPIVLYKGRVYTFPAGSKWVLEGDDTVYEGGAEFVVTDDMNTVMNKKTD